MAINNAIHLRYIGVIPQTECLEYGFRIEDKDKDPRLIVMMIESGFFKKYTLMFQEAPDLCYQKLLADLRNETDEYTVSSRLCVTASDIAHYRELHPILLEDERVPAPVSAASDAPRKGNDRAGQ
jgi:hypothetical protein